MFNILVFQLPFCKPDLSSASLQTKSKHKIKAQRKKAASTNPARVQPTLPLFDFQTYLREKDMRRFKLLIDQPQKCHTGGDGEDDFPYMLIAVKSTAADFDKRQVTEGFRSQTSERPKLEQKRWQVCCATFLRQLLELSTGVLA